MFNKPNPPTIFSKEEKRLLARNVCKLIDGCTEELEGTEQQKKDAWNKYMEHYGSLKDRFGQ